MTSPSVTSPIAEEGADVDEAERGGPEREGGTIESDCLDQNCTLLRSAVAVSMVRQGKRNRKVV